MTLSVLRLTDGTETINLMTNELDGFFLQEYRPVLSGYKGGGVFQDSPLADNRRPVYTRRETVVQPFVLNAKAVSHDSMARMLQDLLRLLEKAKDYWVSDWYNTPVWLEAKTAKETNLRYALVYMGRVEDYPAPHQQPFTQPGGTPVAQEIGLFLEIGQWLDVDPTVEGGVSSEVTGANYYPLVNTITARGNTQPQDSPEVITTSDHASIQDLPPAGFTIDMWFKSIAGDGEIHFFCDKGVGSIITNIRNDSPSSNFVISHATTDARFDVSSAVMNAEVFDGAWHHLAWTFDGTNAPRFWVDGSEITYNNQVAPVGAYVTDVGNDLEWFHVVSDTVSNKFEVGWVRVSDTDRWSSSFTPPERCTPPVIDANTVLQYNMQEGSGTTIDNAEGTAATDGTLDLDESEWTTANDCPITVGAVPATTSEVFTANKFVARVRINNWHIGTGGANLIGGSWPATIFSGATDTYVGSVEGLFNNIVVNLVAGGSGTAPTWQYWNGAAWTTLTLSNANMPEANLDRPGQVILSWKPPTNWAQNSPGGGLPTAYWVRQTANIGTIQHAGPNDPYTVTWPFIQIDGDQLPGDIPALARMLLRPVGSDGTNNASGAADKIIYGSRTRSRGQAFRSHINLSPTGNVSGIFIDDGSGTFTASNEAPTGTLVAYTATTTPTAACGAFINGAISKDYAGRFRVFVRFSYQLLTTATALNWVFRVQYGSNGSFFDSRPVVIDDTYEGSNPLTNPYLLEFNPIQIRSDLLVGTTSEVGEIIFYPYVFTDSGTATVHLHDIVMIPTDEFSGEVERSPQSGNQASAIALVDVDGTNQKLYNRAVKRTASNNRIEELWLSRGVLPPSLQANATQRVFFLQRSTASATNPEQSVSWQTLGVKLGKVSRYLGFRGDR